jgi:two-component system OmpR family response regulator
MAINQNPVILLVEDDKGSSDLMQAMISKATDRCTTLVAASIEECQKVLATHPDLSIDLLILDIMLEDGTGEVLVNIVKQRSPDASVIIASALALSALADILGSVEFDDYLRKPLDVRTTINVIKQDLASSGGRAAQVN